MVGRIVGAGWQRAARVALCASWLIACGGSEESGQQASGVSMFVDVPPPAPAQVPAPQPMAPPPTPDPTQTVTPPPPTQTPEPMPMQPLPEPQEPNQPPPMDTAGGGAMDGMAGMDAPTPEPVPGGDLESLRQLCVDTINDFRASIGMGPLARASGSQESCSDQGAASDAGPPARPHGSAGSCSGLGAQNTCPNWTVGFRNPTVEDALVGCLTSMWNEGEPPNGREACIADRGGCFLDHGHYINMTSATASVVACGFHESSPGTWWMNQDFGR